MRHLYFFLCFLYACGGSVPISDEPQIVLTSANTKVEVVPKVDFVNCGNRDSIPTRDLVVEMVMSLSLKKLPMTALKVGLFTDSLMMGRWEEVRQCILWGGTVYACPDSLMYRSNCALAIRERRTPKNAVEFRYEGYEDGCDKESIEFAIFETTKTSEYVVVVSEGRPGCDGGGYLVMSAWKWNVVTKEWHAYQEALPLEVNPLLFFEPKYPKKFYKALEEEQFMKKHGKCDISQDKWDWCSGYLDYDTSTFKHPKSDELYLRKEYTHLTICHLSLGHLDVWGIDWNSDSSIYPERQHKHHSLFYKWDKSSAKFVFIKRI